MKPMFEMSLTQEEMNKIRACYRVHTYSNEPHAKDEEESGVHVDIESHHVKNLVCEITCRVCGYRVFPSP